MTYKRTEQNDNLDSTVNELADWAHPAAQVEIAGWAMAHSDIPLLQQVDFVFF